MLESRTMTRRSFGFFFDFHCLRADWTG